MKLSLKDFLYYEKSDLSNVGEVGFYTSYDEIDNSLFALNDDISKKLIMCKKSLEKLKEDRYSLKYPELPVFDKRFTEIYRRLTTEDLPVLKNHEYDTLTFENLSSLSIHQLKVFLTHFNEFGNLLVRDFTIISRSEIHQLILLLNFMDAYLDLVQKSGVQVSYDVLECNFNKKKTIITLNQDDILENMFKSDRFVFGSLSSSEKARLLRPVNFKSEEMKNSLIDILTRFSLVSELEEDAKRPLVLERLTIK